MYRVQASCKRHSTHHNMLMLLFKQGKWQAKVVNEVVRVEKDFDTIALAQTGRHDLEVDIRRLERQVNRRINYGLIFSNAYWVSDPIPVKE